MYKPDSCPVDGVHFQLLDDWARMIDGRAKMIDWWLEATAIFLTLIGIAAAILGYVGFRKLGKVESEAHEHMKASEKHALAAQRYLEETRESRDKADSLVEGMNAEIAGDNPEKTSEVVEHVQQNPESSPIDRAVIAALSLQQNRQFDEAIQKWRSIANVVEGVNRDLETQAWFSVGYLSSTRDEPDLHAALSAYDVVLRLNPCNAEAYNNRGNVKDDLGRYEAAIADYDQALRLNPGYEEAYYNRGLAKSRRGQHEVAIDDYEEALRLNPNHAEAYNSRGFSKDRVGRPEDALADYDQALRLNPDFPDAHYNRGLAKLKLRRQDARQDFEAALNLAQVVGNEQLATQAAQALGGIKG